MSVQRVLILLWKYLLVKEEELFYWWKVSKFLLAPIFANARRVDVSKFRVENTAILRLRPRKLIFLFFCENNLHQITYLPKSYLWTKNEGNRFFNSCHLMVDISWPSLLISSIVRTELTSFWEESHKEGKVYITIIIIIYSFKVRFLTC